MLRVKNEFLLVRVVFQSWNLQLIRLTLSGGQCNLVVVFCESLVKMRHCVK